MEQNSQDIVVRLEHVHKRYKLYKNDKQRLLGILFRKHVKAKIFHALNDISFTIRRGESVGIVGRNGAGKSTLLKIITGVTYVDSGTVEVRGQVSALLELAAGFDLEMTGRENIYLKGYILGLTNEEIKAIEDEIIDFAELGAFIDQPVRTYSSGMRARLGFAVNANVHPDILVIDEALSVGDAAFGEKCRRKVAEIISEGVTVLFVSHAKDKIREFCQRGILMEKGCLLKDGPVDEILKEYDALMKGINAAAQKKKAETSVLPKQSPIK